MSIKSSNINRIGVLAVCLLSFIFSCKKKQPHELTGDKAIFVGTWHWMYSTHRHNYCEGGDVVTDTLTPESEGHFFDIIIEEEASIRFFQDNTFIAEHDIFVNNYSESISCTISNSKKFNLSYSYDSDSKFNGCINSDTIKSIHFDEFLFPYTPGCEEYHNYFVKE